MTEAQAAEHLLSLIQPNGDGDGDEMVADEAQPEDEDIEGDEPDVDEDEGDPDADPDEDAEDQEQPRTFKVKVNGEELEVSEDELVKGYSREQDYTRKSMALAEDRKVIEQERQAVAETRTQYAQKLETLTGILQQAEPRVDQSLRETNPAEWSAQMLQHRQWAEQKRAVEAEQARTAQEQEAEEAKAQAEYVAQERSKLLSALPEWSDEAVAKADMERMVNYAIQSVGLSEEEVSSIVDHRVVVALRKAMLFDELKAKAPETRSKVEKVKAAAPGSRNGLSKNSEIKRARERLAQSGSVDDAAAIFARLAQ